MFDFLTPAVRMEVPWYFYCGNLQFEPRRFREPVHDWQTYSSLIFHGRA